jgi:hypothetical protein
MIQISFFPLAFTERTFVSIRGIRVRRFSTLIFSGG